MVFDANFPEPTDSAMSDRMQLLGGDFPMPQVQTESDSTESSVSVVGRVGALNLSPHMSGVESDPGVRGVREMQPPPPVSIYPALPDAPPTIFSPDLVAWCMQTLDRFRSKGGHSETPRADDGSISPDKSRGPTPMPSMLGKHDRGTPTSEGSHLSPKRGRPREALAANFDHPMPSSFSTPRRSTGGRSSRSASSSQFSQMGHQMEALTRELRESQERARLDFLEQVRIANLEMQRQQEKSEEKKIL